MVLGYIIYTHTHTWYLDSETYTQYPIYHTLGPIEIWGSNKPKAACANLRTQKHPTLHHPIPCSLHPGCDLHPLLTPGRLRRTFTTARTR